MALIFGRACASGTCANPCCPPPDGVGGSGSSYVGVPSTWAGFSSGSALTGATWSATSLPTGVTINSSTGFLTGSVATAGTYNISVTATTSCGAVTRTFVLTIDPCPACSSTFYGANASVVPNDVCIDDLWGTSGTFPCPTALTVTVETFTGEGRFQILANGSVIYDSGCLAAGSYVTASVTVPALTNTLRFTGTCNCTGGSGMTLGYDFRC